MNFRTNVFPATVMNVTDPLQEDRVQIKIAHLHDEVAIPQLPWALPWDSSMSGGTATSGSSHVPALNSKVWVAIENMDLLDPIYYISSFRYKTNSAFVKQFYAQISTQVTGLTSKYPSMKFTKLASGIMWGASDSAITPEVFLYHPSGTQIFINSTGLVRIKKGTISLATELSTLLTNIQSMTMMSPVGPTSPPLNASAFATNQSNLAQLLLP